MIQVDDLSVAFHGLMLFKEATFSIQAGERCGLVGRNGSGKSTLFRLLLGQEIPDSGTISKPKNCVIGALSQHIHFTEKTIIDEAALALPADERDSIYKAETILFGLGLTDEDMVRNPQELSGGYQLRLHLAKVLIAEPNFLLLDEPTNYLDIVSIRWLTRFLKQWKGTFILISHDREFMDEVTTHTMGIHRGKVQKVRGDTIAFYDQLILQEEVHEKTRNKMEKKKEQAQAFIDRFGAKASKAAQAQSRAKQLARIPTLEKLKSISHLDFQFTEAVFHSKKMLEAADLFFSYDENGSLINELSLAIEKGERIAIIGKNGRGKSTILKLLAQELKPASGTLKVSENVRYGYFGQTNINRLHPNNTVEEEIAAANRSINITQVKSIAGLMMFSGDLSNKPISVLSGGEKSRVLLGKILATPCNLLMLDEPTHHLDMESIEALIDALEDFEGAVIVVTHSELILKRLQLDKIVVCRQGSQELFLGGYEDFLEGPGWGDDDSKPKKKVNDAPKEKQLRADAVAQRSKLLKPLDLQIASSEKEITTLEIEQANDQTKLLEISQKGNGLAIQELSKTIAARHKRLDTLYQTLQELSDKREALIP